MLHPICQQIRKTQQWPQNWKRSVFISIPKKDKSKECSNYCTIALISHASKVMLKILQARLQQYMNCAGQGCVGEWGLSTLAMAGQADSHIILRMSSSVRIRLLKYTSSGWWEMGLEFPSRATVYGHSGCSLHNPRGLHSHRGWCEWCSLSCASHDVPTVHA